MDVSLSLSLSDGYVMHFNRASTVMIIISTLREICTVTSLLLG